MPKRFLRCKFTNFSRIPLLSVTVYLRAGFHHGRTEKWEHNDYPFELGPGEAHTVWILNSDNEPISVRAAQHARYARFPMLEEYHDQTFQPVIGDYWILTRSDDPDEHLDPIK